MSKKPIFELFKLLCSKVVRLRKLGLEHIFTGGAQDSSWVGSLPYKQTLDIILSSNKRLTLHLTLKSVIYTKISFITPISAV